MSKPIPVRAAFLLSLAVLLIPVMAVRIPPLMDYANHLARIWLLGGGAEMPPVSSMYAIEWSTFTNIGIDLLAMPLARILSAETTIGICLALALILVPLGTAVLNRAIFGGWHWWTLGIPILAWNGALLAGFLNFELGLGLALLGAAADPLLVRRGSLQALILRVIYAMMLTVVHVFGLVFYAALLCGLALGPDARALLGRGGITRASLRLLPVLAAMVLVLAAFVLVSPALPGSYEANPLHSVASDLLTGFHELLQRRKRVSAFAWIWSYDLTFDLAVLALAALPLILAAATGRLRVHAGLLLITIALVVLFIVTPFRLAGTYWVDRRFVFMAPLALAAALRPDLSLPQARMAAALLLGLSLTRTTFIGYVWHLRQADVAAVERALQHIPPGAALLPAEHTPLPRMRGPLGRYFSGGEPSFAHYASLAVPERHAFVPTLFSGRGKQPLRVLPPWDAIAVPDSGPITVHGLLDLRVQQSLGWAAPYIRVWRERFDYVLVLNADLPDLQGSFVPPPDLGMVADEGFAQLYRVLRPDGGAADGR